MPVFELPTYEGALEITLWPFARHGGLEVDLIHQSLSRGRRDARDSIDSAKAYINQKTEENGTQVAAFDNANDAIEQLERTLEKYQIPDHALGCD